MDLDADKGGATDSTQALSLKHDEARKSARRLTHQELVLFLTDFLTDQTRRDRTALVVACGVVLAIALTGLVPTKIAALGIELAQPERTTMLRILAGVIAYLAAAFTVHGLSDYANWRTLVAAKGRDSAGDQLHANQEKVLAAGNEDRRAKITDSFERLDREQQDQAVQRARVGLYKIIQNQEPPYFRYVVWMRVAFDLGVPLILAIATGVVLLVIDSAAPK